MFHYRDNLFFGRKTSGAVRIVKFTTPPNEWPHADSEYIVDVLFDVTIDNDSWPSIVSSVSAGGEANNGYYIAKRFHDNAIRK